MPALLTPTATAALRVRGACAGTLARMALEPVRVVARKRRARYELAGAAR